MNNLLVAEELEKSYGIRKLLDKIAFLFSKDMQYSLIGKLSGGKEKTLSSSCINECTQCLNSGCKLEYTFFIYCIMKNEINE